MTPATESVSETTSLRRSYTRIAKAVVVGDAAVGKTSILVRYVKGIFNPTYILTIGVAFHVKDIVVGDDVLRMQIWDTGGQERFGPIRRLYYRGAKGVLLVYDRANLSSFDKLSFWLKEIERGCGQVPIVLVGNKADLDAVIEKRQGKKFARDHSLDFVETSAKTDKNTDKAFSILAQRIVEYVS